jgi:CheY-like chemotaxis protein/glycine cleavage system H lipoate-binding protein
VDEAGDVDAGMAKLADRSYRLVLSDLMLPGVGGMQLLQTVQRDYPETPLVMITGYPTLDRTAECFRNGAYDVLPKPFDVLELVAIVRRALDYVELDATQRKSVGLAEFTRARGAGNSAPTRLFSLGQHAWVSLEPNGTVKVGVGESFRPLIEVVRVAEFPAIDSEVLQGNECASLTTPDGLVHRVWAPLSCTIVETNPIWEENRPGTATLSDHWLIGAVPTDLENELERLSPR